MSNAVAYPDSQIPTDHIENGDVALHVRDKAIANDAIERLRELQNEKAEIEEDYAARVEVLARRHERRVERLDGQIEYYKRGLEAYLLSRDLTAESLAEGRIRLRQMPEGVQEIEDEDRFIEFHRGHVEGERSFVRVKPETYAVDRKAILDHYKATGEIPDGVEIARKPPVFELTTD